MNLTTKFCLHMLVAVLSASCYADDPRVIETSSDTVICSKPSFPLDSKGNPVEAWVVLQLNINSLGEIEGAEVVESSGNEVIESHAIKTIRFWDFSHYVNNTVRHKISYDLDTPI